MTRSKQRHHREKEASLRRRLTAELRMMKKSQDNLIGLSLDLDLEIDRSKHVIELIQRAIARI